ncbi:MAG: hypothetical protein ABJA35_00630, partial [Parafilimonas sp.]
VVCRMDFRNASGDEVFRVTARKDEWGEIANSSDGKTGWICNECRFEKKDAKDWILEGTTKVNRQSVIAQNKYVGLQKPPEFLEEIMHDVKPRYMLDIHNVSEVNEPEIRLDLIEGPAHSEDFEIADEKRIEKNND